MRALCWGSLVVVVAVVAHADEPPGLARLVRSADKAAVDKALKDAGAAERCKATLTKNDLDGLHCRLIVAAAVAQKPLVKDVDVDARAAVVADALGAAEHIAAYTPTAPEPGLRRTRFEAHRLACDIAFTAVAELEGMPAEFPGAARARELVVGVSPTKALPPVGMRDNACACATRTVDLAVGADAAPAEQAAVQGVLTRQRCLLANDKLKIAERKDPGVALSSGPDALRSLAQANSPAGRLVSLARGRLVQMARCTNKHVDDNKVKDKDKLALCACAVAKRWPLPFKKDDPKVVARVPLLENDGLLLPLTVEAGAITACGDVEGPLLAP
jgi:hypothetical protein